MSTPTLTRAAELLECEAAILRESCTDADGEWSDKCELLRTAHDERMRVAADLRAMIAAAPQPPAIGERWPGIPGIYAGVARGLDGEPDGHLVLLDARPAGELNHADATAWAEGLGNGARLPTRFESCILYANLRDRIETAGWYWTSTLYSDGDAWSQNFYYGELLPYGTYYEGRAVAVIRIPVSAAQPADVAQTVAWARIHPDGSLAGDLLLDADIEDVRKRSGAWVPLARAQAAQPADVARLVEALDWIDDFIARCNGNDRGACEAVNRVRAALAAKGGA